MSIFPILFVGDVVGKPGRQALVRYLPELQAESGCAFTIINVENAASGHGLTKPIYHEIMGLNVQALTSGNHIFDKKDLITVIDQMDALIRPFNYPPGNPGQGFRIFQTPFGPLAVINLQGRVFIGNYDCPFRAIDEILAEIRPITPMIVVDFHAEATSEKQAFGWYVDGRVSAVWGTHTHVQTADERILPKGTGYISDVGMAGARDSVIGMNIDPIIHRFLTQYPERFEPPPPGHVMINGIKTEIDTTTGKTVSLTRIFKTYDLKN